MATALLAFCGLSTLRSAACCLASQLCCSLGSCFSCSRSPKVARFLYLFIFALSAAFAIVMRYYGESILGPWVKIMQVCTDDNSVDDSAAKCWGLQGAYRVSASLCGFFVTMIPIVLIHPRAHLAAWLLKFFWWIALLGISLAIPNDFFGVYADISRYLSAFFLLAQVLIIIDFAYRVHQYLLNRSQAKDRHFEATSYEPGILSNCWKVLYLVLTVGGFIACIVVISLMFKYLAAPGCGDSASLMHFFLSETLIIGIFLTAFSAAGCIGRGLLTPVIIFCYTTYLCYGALTNNTDINCNPFANQNSNNKTSIIVGVVIAVLSITWAAFSAAGNFMRVISDGGATAAKEGAEEALKRVREDSEDGAEVHNVLSVHDDTEMGHTNGIAKHNNTTTNNTAGALEVTASHYSAAASGNVNSAHTAALQKKSSSSRELDLHNEIVSRKIWLFHLIMALGSLYLAMVTTNWGDESKISTLNSNPELSVASMWVRMGTQFAINILFFWTLIAPICCAGREFAN